MEAVREIDDSTAKGGAEATEARRNIDLFLDFTWERELEQRRTQAVVDRLSLIYYLTERTIFRIVKERTPGYKYEQSDTAITAQEVPALRWKIFRVMAETFMGGHMSYHVIVQGRVLSTHPTPGQAKEWITTQAKLIQHRLELVRLAGK